jgi:signal transduction histidine kinase
MKLKFRIAVLFSLFVFIILLISAVSIYILNENFRKEDFFVRLKDEAQEAAHILFKHHRSHPNILTELSKVAASPLREESIHIFDSSYNILYSTSGNDKPAVSPEAFQVAKAKKEYHLSNDRREAVMLYIEADNLPYYVLASATDTYGYRKVDNLKYILAFTVLGGLVLSGLLSFWYVRQIVKPLEDLKDQMQRINETNLTERVAVAKSNDELSQIGKNFNEMLNRLEHAFEMRRNFVQQASHELRTPMANMLLQTEAALGRSLAVGEYRQVLLSLKEDQQDMISLMNDLLILSQYEGMNHLTDFSEIRVDEVLYNATDAVKQLWPQATVTIDFVEVPEDDEYLKIKGNEALLKSAIENLLKNACQYALDEKVKVTIDAGKTGVTLLFQNIGKQIMLEEQKRLFLPFFRGENSINKKGFGLGLSIVQRIISLHKGSITYKAIGDNINRFTVFFPPIQ